jgi:AraC-like DNA-binding protein
VDLTTLWGARARELRERLGSATQSQRFRILEEALLAARRPLKRGDAIELAIDQLKEGRRVGEVASCLALSRRRFVEVFTAAVGMTPKLFARVQRFQRSLASTHADSSPDWSQLALSCGYFDQSHMIRDFVAFSGHSPAELLRRSGVQVKDGHVALRDTGGSHSSNTSASPKPNVVV